MIYLWGTLRLRLDELNDRHAYVSVFDAGALAGKLVLLAETWNELQKVDR